ncbi:MAG: hypothetical protein WAV73_02105 [Candidatus Moraniibacteriota bacterium]
MKILSHVLLTLLLFFVGHISKVSACDFTATLVSTPTSAPLTVNLRADITSAFGPFLYSNYSCGSGGTVSGQSGNSFTCTYASEGTYEPSLDATIKPAPRCTETVATSVTVTSGTSCTPNCDCAANTCINSTCSDTCQGTCQGTKTCEISGVNGVCGSAAGKVALAAPTTNLCTAGTASAVTGAGPWSWTCTGTNGGTTASCRTRVDDSGYTSFYQLDHPYFYCSKTACPSDSLNCADSTCSETATYIESTCQSGEKVCIANIKGYKSLYSLNDSKLKCGRQTVCDADVRVSSSSFSLWPWTIRTTFAGDHGYLWHYSYPNHSNPESFTPLDFVGNKIKFYVPAGSKSFPVSFQVFNHAQVGAVAKFGSPPEYEMPAGLTWNEFSTGIGANLAGHTIPELKEGQQFVRASQQPLIVSADQHFPTLAEGGWLYVKILSFDGSKPWLYSNSGGVADYDTFKNWYDSATWLSDGDPDESSSSCVPNCSCATTTPMGSVCSDECNGTCEGVAAPALPTGPGCDQKVCLGNSCWNGTVWIPGAKTAACSGIATKANPGLVESVSIKDQPTDANISWLTWSSTDASKTDLACDGPVIIPRTLFFLSSTDWYGAQNGSFPFAKTATDGYPAWFNIGVSGVEVCSFYPTNRSDGLPGTPSLIRIEVKKPTGAVGINGVCGSAAGKMASAAPTANLCATGTASAVTGAGPWSWTCTGTNSGTTASCRTKVDDSGYESYHQTPQKINFCSAGACNNEGVINCNAGESKCYDNFIGYKAQYNINDPRIYCYGQTSCNLPENGQLGLSRNILDKTISDSFKVYVPAGAVRASLDLLGMTREAQIATAARFGQLPDISAIPNYNSMPTSGASISQLKEATQYARNAGGVITVGRSSYSPMISEGGWLYVKILRGNFPDIVSPESGTVTTYQYGSVFDVGSYKQWYASATWLSNGDPDDTISTIAAQTSGCDNFPGANFCPGGEADIITTGMDGSGCAIYACKSNEKCGNGVIDSGETCDGIEQLCPAGKSCTNCNCVISDTKTSCQPDNPDCAAHTCKELVCFDGCQRRQGTKNCP